MRACMSLLDMETSDSDRYIYYKPEISFMTSTVCRSFVIYGDLLDPIEEWNQLNVASETHFLNRKCLLKI